MLFRYIQSLWTRISLGILVLLCAMAQAQANFEPGVLSFEDAPELHVPLATLNGTSGYAGFNWGTAYVPTTLAPVPAAMLTYLAFSSTGTGIVRSDGADFYFDGADFWSRRGVDANGSFYFYLMHDGVVVFDGREDSDTRIDFTATPGFIQSGYAGPIDYMAIVFRQGGDDWDHLAMDNFHFRAQAAPVPEPAASLYMALGLGLVGLIARRRKKV